MARQRPSPRDINISHTSLVNGTTSTHSIPSSVLPAELRKAIEGSDININLTTDRVKRAAGVNNSTINLTVISSRALIDRKARGDELRRERTSKRSAPASSSPAAPQHHNIHIDASSNGAGGVGGIHNSTVNINLHSTTTTTSSARKARRKVALGDHSVLVDVSSSSSSAETGAEGGIEDSTVHVNILPPRALTKSTGHHSIVVDSSSLSESDAAQSSTTTGSHSAVVDTSAGPASNGTASGVKNSTINLTVIAPKDSPAPADAEVPSLARLSKRALPAFQAWSSSIQQRDPAASSGDESVNVPAVAGHNHSSRARMVRIVKRA
ncbi:hypothetical protein JCM10295v2_002633 [Rhodotorula toruloides]